MPVQVQTNQKNGIVQPAWNSLRSNREFGIDRQRVRFGWLIGSQHEKQQRWSDLSLIRKNGWRVQDNHYVHLWHEKWTHGQNMNILAWQGLEDPIRHTFKPLGIFLSHWAYSPIEIYARQTNQGRIIFWHASYWPAKRIKGTDNCKLEHTGRPDQTTSSTRGNTWQWALWRT
jgi:hypothetical protein